MTTPNIPEFLKELESFCNEKGVALVWCLNTIRVVDLEHTQEKMPERKRRLAEFKTVINGNKVSYELVKV